MTIEDKCVWRTMYDTGESSSFILFNERDTYKGTKYKVMYDFLDKQLKDHPLYACTECTGLKDNLYDKLRECYISLKK